MTATFGKLDHRTLGLPDGLTIIQASNESGKTTWAAFLRTMLYGLNTRDRGLLADKNRYAPWSGGAMEGILELEAEGRKITLTRSSPRRSSPMGAFSAVYTGTAEPVPGLSSADCGEQLTGVPREIYERSAFIGQGAMAVDQVASLERRIAALISTGEEGSSYTEVRDRLKKQLNRRRANRSTGLLPELEGQLEELGDRLRQGEALRQEIEALEDQLPALEEREAVCRAAAPADRPGDREARQAYDKLLAQLEEAADLVAQRETEAAGLPGRSGLVALKSAAGSLVVNQMAKKRAEEQRNLRRQEAEKARKPVETFSLFANMSPQEAAEKAAGDRDLWQRLGKRGKLGIMLAAAGLVLLIGGGALVLLRMLPAGAAAGGGGLLLLLLGLWLRRTRGQAAALAAVYGAAAPQDFTDRAEAYAAAYTNWDGCRQAEREAEGRLEGLASAIDEATGKLLEQVRRFSPEAVTLTGAAAAIDRAMGRLDRLESARQAHSLLRARCEAMESALPQNPDSPAAQAAARELEEVRGRLEERRQRLALLRGRLEAIGDPGELESRREELENRRQEALREYDALTLALEVLEEANAQMQTRFSPALGAEAARLLERLTGGRYRKVLLDRELNAQAETGDDPIPRSAQLLSRGTGDQVYLAVRLAICHMVLPAEKAAPLVLDDALAAFDDERMALALEVLREEARQRQVLLLTCQERELAWAEGREDVHTIRLGADGGPLP